MMVASGRESGKGGSRTPRHATTSGYGVASAVICVAHKVGRLSRAGLARWVGSQSAAIVNQDQSAPYDRLEAVPGGWAASLPLRSSGTCSLRFPWCSSGLFGRASRLLGCEPVRAACPMAILVRLGLSGVGADWLGRAGGWRASPQDEWPMYHPDVTAQRAVLKPGPHRAGVPDLGGQQRCEIREFARFVLRRHHG